MKACCLPRAHSARLQASTLAIAACVAVISALIAGLTEPIAASAAEPEAPNTSAGLPMTGAVDLGGGLSATIREADGALSLSLPVGGHVSLSYHSRNSPASSALPDGWAWGLPSVDVSGGVRVVPASGGVFELDMSHPSGLAGYGRGDLTFAAREGRLPGRSGVVGDSGAEGAERSYSYVLEELGGTTTYFDADGDPMVRHAASGNRTDWSWHEDGDHQLIGVADEVGVITTLDWSDDSVEVVAGHPAADGGSAWRAVVDDEQLVALEDPLGGQVRLGYDEGGRLSRVSTPTGATTEFEWRVSTDGAAHVSEMVTRDADGLELRRRSWGPVAGSAAGWPEFASAAASAVANPSGEYRVESVERHLRTVSAFDARGRLVEREVHAAGASGERMLQAHAFTYPKAPAAGTPAGSSVNWARAERSVVSFPDAEGRTRELAESVEFDEYGRQVRHVAADGTVTERAFDAGVPAGRLLPIGLPLHERVTAPDGAVLETRYELTEARTTPLAVEKWARAAGGGADDESVLTGRVEYEYDNAAPFSSVASVERVLGGDGNVEERRRLIRIEDDRLVEQTTDAAGATATAYVDPVTSAPDRVIDAAGRETRYWADALGRPIETRFPDGLVTTAEHHRVGDGEAENATITSFSDGYRVKTVTDELGRVVREADSYAVDPANLDAEGWRTRSLIERDERGNPVRVTDQAGLVTSTTFDASGAPVLVRNPDGSRVESTFDAMAGAQTQRVFEPDATEPSQIITTEYDDHGRETRREIAYGDGTPSQVIELEYDGLGRDLAMTSDEAETRLQYSLDGSVDTVAVTPLAGPGPVVTADHQRDAFGRTTLKTLRADGLEASPARALEYGDGGRIRAETDQLGAITGFEYDQAGDLVSTLLPDGGRTRVELDTAGREQLMRFEGPDGSVDAETAREYDSKNGLLAAMWDPAAPDASRIEYDYHADGLPRSKTYPDGRSLSWEYDDGGRLTAATDATGSRTAYTYDAVGRMTAARQVDSDGEPIADVSYAYDGAGNVILVARGNGGRSEFAYDDAGQVQRETHILTGETLETTSSYDRAGQLTRSRTERTTGEDTMATERRYEYDGHGRLIRSVHDADGDRATAGDQTAREYSFDLATQLETEQIATADGTTTRAYSLDAAGRPSSITQGSGTQFREYDAAGRLVLDEHGSRFEYATTGALSAVISPDGVRTEHTYWADGTLRTTTTGDHRPITHYWDTSSAVPALTNEVTAGEASSYLYGLVREHRTLDADHAEAPAETGYYITDRQSSVLALTGTNGWAGPVYAYGDYGGQEGSASAATGIARNPFTYTGAWEHPATGHLLLGARYYDPATATFTAPDSANTHAKYAYAAGNPVRYTDPTGRTPGWLSWLTVGFAAFTVAVDIAATIATGGLFGPMVAASLSLALAAGASEVLVQVDRDLFDFIPDDHAERLSIAGAVVGGVGALIASVIAAGAVATRALTADRLSAVTKALPDGKRLTLRDLTFYELGALVKRINKEAIPDGDHLYFTCPSAAYACAKTLSGTPTSATSVTPNISAGSFLETADLPGMKKSWSKPLSTNKLFDRLHEADPGTIFVIMGTPSEKIYRPLARAIHYLVTGKSTNLQQNHFFNAVVTGEDNVKQVWVLDAFYGKVWRPDHALSKPEVSRMKGPWRVLVAGTVPTS